MNFITSKQILENYDMKIMIQEVEKAYKQLAVGKAREEQRNFMKTTKGGDLLIGPAVLEQTGYFGAKLSSYSPENEKKALPLLAV